MSSLCMFPATTLLQIRYSSHKLDSKNPEELLHTLSTQFCINGPKFHGTAIEESSEQKLPFSDFIIAIDQNCASKRLAIRISFPTDQLSNWDDQDSVRCARRVPSEDPPRQAYRQSAAPKIPPTFLPLQPKSDTGACGDQRSWAGTKRRRTAVQNVQNRRAAEPASADAATSHCAKEVAAK